MRPDAGGGLTSRELIAQNYTFRCFLSGETRQKLRSNEVLDTENELMR